MVIRISVGNVGSGKTLLEVRRMALGQKIPTYSNIKTKYKHQIDLAPEHIIAEELIDTKTNKATGKETPIYKNTVNMDFWKNLPKPINVVLDEAHSILNARRAMSKVNIIVTDWIALIRKMLGTSDRSGELVLISQLYNRIDNIAREMATQVNFNRCHYNVSCKCGALYYETSDTPESFKVKQCLYCNNYYLKRINHEIEVWEFSSMDAFIGWKEGFTGNLGKRPYYDHYFINDVEKYFKVYDTFQLDNLFSDKYG